MHFPLRYLGGSNSVRFNPLKIGGVLLLIIITTLLVCGGADKSEINELMDARDQAYSHLNIADYSALINNNYHDQGRSKVDVVAQMVALFDRFDRAEMQSHDRQIQQVDDSHALCEQSYTLKVMADGKWRQIVQREQLTLSKESDGWKISGGL